MIGHGHGHGHGRGRGRAENGGGKEGLRDADRSPSAILAAARDESAEYGLGRARVDRIAERAGLNKGLIYYDFADTEHLFQVVLEQACRDLRSAEPSLHLAELEPAMAVRQLVE